jgi:hypothetical protein
MGTRASMSTAAAAAGMLLSLLSSKPSFALPPTSDLCGGGGVPVTESPPPLSQYAKIRSFNQLMFLYYATSLEAPDYKAMAETYSKEYRMENDTFHRADLLAKLRPQLEAGICTANNTQYFTVRLANSKGAYFSHYDEATKGFHVTIINRSCTGLVGIPEFCRTDQSGIATYDFEFESPDQINVPVSDETLARRIEGMVAGGAPPSFEVFAVTDTAGIGNREFTTIHLVKSKVTGLRLIDGNGHELASVSIP